MATGYVVPERPDWTRARLAPAGDRIAAVRWHEGAANVWIGPAGSPMQLASDLRPWRLRDYHWGLGGEGLVLALELPGAEQQVVAWLDLRAHTLTRLTPGLGADAQYVGQAAGDRPSVLIAVRHPFAPSFLLQEVTPAGALLAEWESPRPASRWLATKTHAIAVQACEGGWEWWHTSLATPSWSRILVVPGRDEESRPLAISADGQTLYALSSVGRDTIALVAMSAPAWTPRILSADDRFDITSVLMSPGAAGPDLVTTTDPVSPQAALSDEAAADLAQLRQVADGSTAVIIGRNDGHCLAEVSFGAGGPAFVTISRASASATMSKPLARFTSFARVRVQGRDPVSYRARDSRLVTGFVTRPSTAPPWPAVLTIHDGPWSRDAPQLDPWAQSLAAAGLACIQVNYRGSRGFGKDFRDAGDGQWALAMQDDLIDALLSDELTELCDRQRVTAIGYGYGGYAALMLATQSEVPLAGVASASAPTDLLQYVSRLTSIGGRQGAAEAARIGDPVADQGRLMATSPVARVGDVAAPVLLFHGRQDARVPVSHAMTMAESLRRAGRDCELTIYEDEGHRYVRPQNISDLRTRTIGFLLRCVSGATDAAVR